MTKITKDNFILILLIVVCITITVGIIILDQKYNMRHYFDNWTSETDEEIVHVLNDSFVYGRLDLQRYVNGLIKEVYCVRNERIYFCYITDSNSNSTEDWHIASIEINGQNLIDHYSGNLFDKSNSLGFSYEYERLAYQTYDANNYGGLYSNNKIYLHGKDKTVVYDIDSNTLNETSDYPISRYICNINEHKTITIEDTEQNLSKTITLESMAENNAYSEKLLKLSSRKNWDGTSPTKRLFSMVKVVDDQIYIICSVLNWNGEAFAVVFKYDFLSSSTAYVSFQKVGDRVDSNYSFAQ